ncbi:integrase catalytic domain-containing protein [Trichonephila clavipes]|nr:integrase catalytic domain-containing protein [Trichonephila clavipes]
MAPKQSKNIGKFDLIIKELKAFGSRINECDDNKSHIRVLKTQVLQYETRLTEIFSELSTHESDESFDIYMKYKDILFNWVVDLGEKSQVEEVNSSIHASVRGDAAKLIRGFAITVDNLKNCWDILCSRYENKRQLALSQINKLFSIKIYRANTSKLLLEIIDICNEVIRNLKTLDLETNSLTELIIINFLISKVDACISQRWELSLENNKIPTLEEFRVFIERVARGLNELKFVKPDIKKAGADSLDSARKIVHELQNLMSAGGFELREWSCTHPEVLSDLPNTLKTNIFSHSFDDESTQKILGLFWDLNEDSFKVRAVLSDQVSTKRQMISIIARIFDPLGFVCPSTIILKIILQDLWKAGLDWDDEISSDILNIWNRFQAEISCLKQIKVPRYVQTQNAKHCEIHGLCDASSKAYSAVIYLRVVSDSPHLFLMASKTRVAPVQTISLPKLELCGALLLAELLDIFKKSLNITHDTFLWCDSTITLSWINNPPVKGNQFVQHRVGKIHALTSKESWHHIPGKLNPTDWATRGLYPKQLLENSEWVAGPKWLHDFYPSSNSFIPFSEQPVSLVPIDKSESLSDYAVLSTGVDYSLSFLDKFSSYMKVVRTVAWIFRFYHSSKSVSKVTEPLYTHELETSIKKVVKLLQNGEYHTELTLLKCNKPLPKSSKLQSLNVFLDSEGISCVGGRLRLQQTLKFEQKHPMLVPKEHHFTSLVISHFHRVNFHAGQELVLSLIRQQF